MEFSSTEQRRDCVLVWPGSVREAVQMARAAKAIGLTRITLAEPGRDERNERCDVWMLLAAIARTVGGIELCALVDQTGRDWGVTARCFATLDHLAPHRAYVLVTTHSGPPAEAATYTAAVNASLRQWGLVIRAEVQTPPSISTEIARANGRSLLMMASLRDDWYTFAHAEPLQLERPTRGDRVGVRLELNYIPTTADTVTELARRAECLRYWRLGLWDSPAACLRFVEIAEHHGVLDYLLGPFALAGSSAAVGQRLRVLSERGVGISVPEHHARFHVAYIAELAARVAWEGGHGLGV